MTRARRSVPPTVKEIAFTVTPPYGASYCIQLTVALRKLGVAVGENPFIEGSDSSGFLAAQDRAALAKARATIRASYRTEPEKDNDTFAALLATLRESGVYEIMQDWKRLAWSVDVPTLRRLGVALKHVPQRSKQAALAFTVSSLTRKRRRRP